MIANQELLNLLAARAANDALAKAAHVELDVCYKVIGALDQLVTQLEREAQHA